MIWSVYSFQYLLCTYNVKRQKLTTGKQNQTAWFDCCLYVHRHSICMLIHVKAKERKQMINTEIYIPNIRKKAVQMQNQFRLQGVPNSSSGNVLLGHIFDPQYDGYLQAHKIQGIAYHHRYRITNSIIQNWWW